MSSCIQIGLPRRATVAGSNMRTWTNALPPRAHPEAASEISRSMANEPAQAIPGIAEQDHSRPARLR
jgi:hypothetical protein